jgi:hypothetical protein
MTETLVRRLLDANPIREQGWPSATGLERLAKKYGATRLEAACAQALRFGARSYKPVERILALGRESTEAPDLLEVMEDRYGKSATVVTSQLPIANWHGWLGDPTVVDAVLDRLVHNAYKLDLRGNSKRKEKAPASNEKP